MLHLLWRVALLALPACPCVSLINQSACRLLWMTAYLQDIRVASTGLHRDVRQIVDILIDPAEDGDGPRIQ